MTRSNWFHPNNFPAFRVPLEGAVCANYGSIEQRHGLSRMNDSGIWHLTIRATPTHTSEQVCGQTVAASLEQVHTRAGGWLLEDTLDRYIPFQKYLATCEKSDKLESSLGDD
ncbi:hypothetical protein K0M31_002429 [Melipona bicolor]|uniref:Uncharacterized protein n=1 Tax=Melipona bicolor TaxID=60889 RepID=A0AA40GHP2_9HYME|nr:hypothetical protein K0M31_002429 [Melipona bicolor]